MYVDSSGYATGYDQKSVKACATCAAEGIARAKAEHGDDIAVIVRGNSGVSCAFAALMQENFNLCLLRKRCDNSHGSPLEGPDGFSFEKYIILDDFISTGDTVDGIIEDLDVLSEAKGATRPKCVGLVLYNSARRSGYTSSIGRLKNYTYTQ